MNAELRPGLVAMVLLLASCAEQRPPREDAAASGRGSASTSGGTAAGGAHGSGGSSASGGGAAGGGGSPASDGGGATGGGGAWPGGSGGGGAAPAGPLDLTLPTTLGDALAFLWTGADPVQTGVAPGAIEVRRAAAIRGVVRDQDGAPLPGIAVSIQDHPEYGSTQTFADGGFTMAVSGGGPLIVSYQADGYLPVARQVEVPWQDHAHAPDVVLTLLDPQVTVLDLAALPAYAPARGSVTADNDGARQATILFPPGTSAQAVLPGGARSSRSRR